MSAPTPITQEVLDSIVCLYRQDDHMSLWGIPYSMREGQSPRNLKEAQRAWQAPREGHYGSKQIDLADWVWLGAPRWYYKMPPEEQALVQAFLDKHKDWVPQDPHDWVDLTHKEEHVQ